MTKSYHSSSCCSPSFTRDVGFSPINISNHIFLIMKLMQKNNNKQTDKMSWIKCKFCNLRRCGFSQNFWENKSKSSAHNYFHFASFLFTVGGACRIHLFSAVCFELKGGIKIGTFLVHKKISTSTSKWKQIKNVRRVTGSLSLWPLSSFRLLWPHSFPAILPCHPDAVSRDLQTLQARSRPVAAADALRWQLGGEQTIWL